VDGAVAGGNEIGQYTSYETEIIQDAVIELGTQFPDEDTQPLVGKAAEKMQSMILNLVPDPE
jgi:hypothetical protein